MVLAKNRGRIDSRIPPSSGQLRVTKVLSPVQKNLQLVEVNHLKKAEDAQHLASPAGFSDVAFRKFTENRNFRSSARRGLLNRRCGNFCRLRRSKFLASGPCGSCIDWKTKGIGKVERFLQLTLGPVASYFEDRRSEVLMTEDIAKGEYDLYSAVTFFLVGLGVGSVLALFFSPRQKVAPQAINSNWRRAA
jgi:hypothetical protein